VRQQLGQIGEEVPATPALLGVVIYVAPFRFRNLAVVIKH
jgi:hypothetical protein